MARLPTGTVTFLFTDIEGSTRLADRLGDRYGEVLVEQRRVLQSAFAQAGGHEVDTQGDSAFVVFLRAKDAVEAAVAVQRELAAHPWPAGAQPRVRVGIHSGEPTVIATGYAGLDVHCAARVCAAGHGGQVLVSQTTRGLLDGGLPEGVEIRDLGEHRLKDLNRSQHLFQLLIRGLENDFPLLRTLENRATNLPVLTTPFLGRERELKDVCALLRHSETRLVTLTGPGGIGKTRVALQAAAEVLNEFSRGVYLVRLAAVRDPRLVLATLAQTLGVREGGGRSLRETLTEFLAEEHRLVLLDNFEQLLAGAPVLSELLSACPSLNLLVTSRAPLRLSGEQEYPVPPLLLPDREHPPEPRLLSQFEAVALFVARARAVRPDFSLTEVNAWPIAEICHRLDGLPLAIELAAARSKVLPPQAILGRLEQNLDLLSGGPCDLPARQRTLRATIDWSYELLQREEQRLFARLSVFIGRLTLDAVQAVCNADLGIDVLEGLTRLVNDNLLRQEETPEGEPRFLMLETLHEYARERLEENGEAGAMRRRHADYFLELAERAEPELRADQQVLWLDRLEREHDNLRAALEWTGEAGETELQLRLAFALRSFWRVRGYLSEGRLWLEEALVDSGDQPAGLRARAMNGAAVLAFRQGDFEPAKRLATESLNALRDLGDKSGAARALHVLASVALGERDYEGATALLRDSEVLARELADKALLATTIVDLGDVALNEGAYERATELFAESLELFRELGDRDGMAIALFDLGSAALHRGRLEQASGLLEEALRLFSELGYREGVAYCLEGLAAIAASQRWFMRSGRLLGAADAISEAVGVTLEPAELDRHEHTLALLRAQLGGTRLRESLAAGRELTVQKAVEYALAP
jgi:predicted ATPase/class 3 adenylate cyclase